MVDLRFLAQFLLVWGSAGACVFSGLRRVQSCAAFITGCALVIGLCGYTFVSFVIFISFCSTLFLMASEEIERPFSGRKEMILLCFGVGAGYCGKPIVGTHKGTVDLLDICKILLDQHALALVAFLCILSCVLLSAQNFIASVRSEPRAKKSAQL